MHSEIRQAGVWILAAVGTATGLAMWRFWPQNEMSRDSGELGRKIAARARSSIPLPSVTAGAGAGPATEAFAAPVVAAPTSVAPKATMTVPVAIADQPATTSSWWQNLFWKQR